MGSSDVEAIAFAPGSPGLVIVGHRAGRLLSVSSDGGKTWKTSDLGIEVKNQLPFAVSGTHWVVASRAGGALRVSDDAGGQWQNGDGGNDYFAGPLPVIQTGDFLLQSRHHGFVKSIDGGKTWQYVMEQHTRVVGVSGESVFRENRQGIRGTDDRIFTIEMSDNYAQSWSDVTEGLQLAVPDDLRAAFARAMVSKVPYLIDVVVDRAADLSRMCRLPSASVFTGQEAVMVNPASIKPPASASHAPAALCVNITVMMPSGFRTRRCSLKIEAIRC